MGPISVVHLVTSLERGGAETVLLQALRAAAMRERTVAVVQLLPGKSLVEPIQALGIPVITLAPGGIGDLISVPFKLRRFLAQQPRPLVVHSWLYHADFAISVSRIAMSDVAVVWGLHTTGLSAQSGFFTTRLLRRLLAVMSHHSPEHVIACSESAANVHRDLGYAGPRMVVIPNGISTEVEGSRSLARLSLRRQCGFNDDAVIIGTLGRNHPDKDPRMFIQMAALVGQRVPSARFVLVGRGFDDSSAQELRSAIGSLGLTGRVRLLGEHPDGRALIRGFDVFALSSATEAMPMVLLEAMAEGIPIAATSVGDVPLMLGDARWIVQPGDAIGMARVVMDHLASEQHRQVIAEALQKRVSAEYSVDRMVDSYLKAYDAAWSGRKS